MLLKQSPRDELLDCAIPFDRRTWPTDQEFDYLSMTEGQLQRIERVLKVETAPRTKDFPHFAGSRVAYTHFNGVNGRRSPSLWWLH